MKWYLKVLSQYADFKGRARRKEYWMFVLFNWIAVAITMILDNALGTHIAGVPYGWCYLVYILATIIPTFAVLVRRLHDIGKSGAWMLIAFIPIVGAIWLLVLMCTDSELGTNKYGEYPKN